MHIVFITDEYPKKGKGHGGIGSIVFLLANSMKALGHRISVIGQNDSAEDETEVENEIDIYRIGKSTWPVLKFVDYGRRLNQRIQAIHKANPIDVIEAPELNFGIVKKIKGVTYIIRLEGGHHFFTLFENRKRELKKVISEKRSFRICDGVIGATKYVYDITHRELKFDKPSIVIPNPIDTNDHEPDESVITDPNLIVFAGTIVEKKGVRQLVQAMPKVLQQFPKCRLEMYGRDWKRPDGSSYMEYLKTFIDENYSSQILLKGEVSRPELKRIMQRAGICIFPSHMEAFGLVWLEALALGKPVVGADVGPGRELITPGVNGILVDPHNPDSIADGLVTLLKDPALCERLGKAAREDSVKRFSLQPVAEKSIAFYQQVKSAKNN